MARARVSRVIGAPPRAVWDLVADIEGHAGWQVDVAAIRVTSVQRHGVGTTYDVHARLGPIRMMIPMTITEWRPRRSVSTRYDGSLRGQGTITVRRRGRGQSKVTWSARVRTPWSLGGPVGAAATAVLLRAVWRRNLAALARLIEVGSR